MTLHELGGLEAARKRFKWLDETDYDDCPVGSSKIEAVVNFGMALIESVESLTAERDALKKRVEELERELGVSSSEVHTLQRLGKEALEERDAQLQAARELASRTTSDYGRYLEGSPGHMLATFQRVEMASEFLKMLEGKVGRDVQRESLPEHEYPNMKDQIGKREA